MESPEDTQSFSVKEFNPNFIIPKKTSSDVDDKSHAVEMRSVVNLGVCAEQPPVVNGHFQQLIKERPKLKRPAPPRVDVCDDVKDDSLPKELREQFQPLYCKLCPAHLCNTVTAKLHYSSKNHEKKVRKFLQEYAEKNCVPVHKRARLDGSRAKTNDEDANNPIYFRCEACDLPLTGKIHAQSHYMGKNHQKVMNGRKAPAGSGYYTEAGQWVRTTPVVYDGKKHDGFGVDFLPPPDPTLTPPGVEKATSLRCEMCKVSVTSLPQMDMHLQGHKHQKKLRALGLASPKPSSSPTHVEISATNLYSSCRTPSGQFYCKVCNTSLNSEIQFGTHLLSKSHIKKSVTAKLM